MKLEEIGFYTLSDERAKRVSITSSMIRAEIIVTNECNLSCVYCRGLRPEIDTVLRLEQVKNNINLLAKHNLKNIRFSGGEPTLHPDLTAMVAYSKKNYIRRIALSTNGTAPISKYKGLLMSGVNDFSISLDGGCCATGTKMCGGNGGAWDKASLTIETLSKETYVTVGIVLNEINIGQIKEILTHVISLNPSDIRLIPSAQYNIFNIDRNLKYSLLEMCGAFPILSYRLRQLIYGDNAVRGIGVGDTTFCPLVLDDVAIAGLYHFPCIIYLREGGYPIGRMSPFFREERLQWFKDFNGNGICKDNCLDVCVAYNNKAIKTNKEKW